MVGAGVQEGGKWRWSSRRDIGFRWDMVGYEATRGHRSKGSGNSNADIASGDAVGIKEGPDQPSRSHCPESSRPRRRRRPEGAMRRQRAARARSPRPPGTEPQTKERAAAASAARLGRPAGPVPALRPGLSRASWPDRLPYPSGPPAPAPAPNLVDLRPGSRVGAPGEGPQTCP